MSICWKASWVEWPNNLSDQFLLLTVSQQGTFPVLPAIWIPTGVALLLRCYTPTSYVTEYTIHLSFIQFPKMQQRNSSSKGQFYKPLENRCTYTDHVRKTSCVWNQATTKRATIDEFPYTNSTLSSSSHSPKWTKYRSSQNFLERKPSKRY